MIACLGYSRAGAGVLIFSREAEDLLAGIAGCWNAWAGCRGRWSGTARRASTAMRPPDRRVRRVLRPAQGSAGISASRPSRRPKERSSGCRAMPRLPLSLAGGSRTQLDFQDQLDAWFLEINARTHETLRARPVDRLVDELEAMARLPNQMPDTARRWTMRVPPDPHLRLDSNDYSLDPAAPSAGVSRSSQASAPSPASRSIPASWPAGTRACSHGTGRSPRSSTPAP